MYKFFKIFALLSLFAFTACSTPGILQYDNTKLNLQIEQKRLQVPSKLVKLNKENFSSLFLEQKLLRLEDGSLVMFEDAQTDMQYMFDPTTITTIRVVFDAVRVIPVYEQDFIFAYQLLLKDGRILNIIVSQGYEQELQMVYGMSNQQFIRTLQNLNGNIQRLPYQNAIELKNEKSPIISNWTTWKVSFYPLVIPVPRLGRM